MLSIQELFDNFGEHELELKGYKKIRNDKKKRTLALKASISTNEDENVDEDKGESIKGMDDSEDIILLKKRL